MSFTQQAGGGMERLFYSFKDSGTATQYDPTDPYSYEQFIHSLINDCRDYENSVLAKYRDEAQKFYGECPGHGGSALAETSRFRPIPTLHL